jgi:glycosyltransferase involved in cell wall biosynthesis
MSQRTILITLLDKSYPPEHSFVDGMLSQEVASIPDITVRLCVSRAPGISQRSRRYGKASCLPLLHTRRGAGRFLNLFKAIQLIWYQAAREKKRGRRVVLFVRNDPIYLLAASLLRKRVHRLVFQSSFPHEEFSGNKVKLAVGRFLYRLAARGVDAVTAVSPTGLERVRRICPEAGEYAHIPLLSDLPHYQDKSASQQHSPLPIFIYIGAHGQGRELQLVLQAIVRALASGAKGKFLFIGGNQVERTSLLAVEGVAAYVDQGIIKMQGPIPRTDIPKALTQADIGLTLIPPKPVYLEASPTKLAEYMGAGLAVLASRGIPMQEQFVEESGGGVLVDWGVEAMAMAIVQLCADPEGVAAMKERALEYAEKELQYAKYLPDFLRLMDLKHP